jgi:hypothetical protein
VLLSWSPGAGSDSPVTSYILQYKEASDMWHEHNPQLTVAGDRSVVLVAGLHPATVYHFRLYAENALGTSAPSDPLHVSKWRWVSSYICILNQMQRLIRMARNLMILMYDKFVKRGRQQYWPISNTSLGISRPSSNLSIAGACHVSTREAKWSLVCHMREVKPHV